MSVEVLNVPEDGVKDGDVITEVHWRDAAHSATGLNWVVRTVVRSPAGEPIKYEGTDGHVFHTVGSLANVGSFTVLRSAPSIYQEREALRSHGATQHGVTPKPVKDWPAPCPRCGRAEAAVVLFSSVECRFGCFKGGAT